MPLAVVDAEFEPVHLSAKTVTVVGRPHPLRTETIQTEFMAGVSISEILGDVDHQKVTVRVSGIEIPREMFAVVQPRAGTVVEVSARLRGGDIPDLNNLTQQQANDKSTGWGIAHGIGTAALTFIPYVGPLLAAIAGPVGSIIIGSVIKPAPIKEPPKPRKFYGIEGTKNEPRPYGPVMMVLGTVRLTPPLVTGVYSEWLAPKTVTRLVADLGYGNLSVDDPMLGSAPLANYGDSTRYIVGTNLSSAGDVDVAQPNQPIAATTPLEVLAATASDCERFLIELVWNQTFFKQDNSANPPITRGYTDIRFRYRSVAIPGSPGPWINMLTANNVVREDSRPGVNRLSVYGVQDDAYCSRVDRAGEWYLRFEGSDSPYEPFVFTGIFYPPTPGVYEVSVTRITDAQTGFQESSSPMWTKLISTSNRSPSNLPTTKVDLTIQASSALNSELPPFTVKVSQLIPTWNGSAWVQAETSNPAYIYRWLLTGCPMTLRQVPASRVDDERIIAWATFCATKGLVFNDSVDEQIPLFDLLQQVCAAGRATFSVRDGKYSVVVDQEQPLAVQVFTPRNSAAFAANRSFTNEIHGVAARFSNADVNYQTDARIVYAPGYSFDGAGGTITADPKKIADMDFPGVTSPDAVWRLAKYHLAVALSRQNMYSLTAGVENLVCQRGDRVKVVHDVTDWGVGWGRVIGLQNIFMPYSDDLGTNDPYDGFYGTTPNFSGANMGIKFQTLKEGTLLGVKLWIPPHTGGYTGMVTVDLWGPQTNPLRTEVKTGLAGGQMHLVYFRIPIELEAGEYAVSFRFPNTVTQIQRITDLHAVGYQTGPLFVPDRAAFKTTLNPLTDANQILDAQNGVRGIEPIFVCDAPSTNDRALVQEFEIDEAPHGEMYALSNYTVSIRSRLGKGVVYEGLNALYPHNIARTVENFSRASPTGSYLDKDGKLRYTNINHTQRNTYDENGNFVGLLVEAAMTNQCLNSDDFSAASWTKDSLSVTPNQKEWATTIGSADRLTALEENTEHKVTSNSYAVSDNVRAGCSVFVHAGTSSRALVSLRRRDSNLISADVNLLTGEAVLSGPGSSTATLWVQKFPDGWWRVGITGSVAVGGGGTALVVHVLNANGDTSYAGAGETIYVVGGQLELGAYVSSYLPSAGTANTRAAETVNLAAPVKYGKRAGLSQKEGTLVFEFLNNSLNPSNSDQQYYFRLGDWSAGFGALFTINNRWVFGPRYGVNSIVSAEPMKLGLTRIVVTWKEDPSDPDARALAMSVNGGPALLSLLPSDEGPLLMNEADFSNLLKTVGGSAASFAISQIHAYDYAFDTEFLHLSSLVGAQLPKENAYWLGLEIAQVGSPMTYGDIVAIGRTGQEQKDLLITQITPKDELSAELVCFDYVPAIYNADAGTPPPFESALDPNIVSAVQTITPPIFEYFVQVFVDRAPIVPVGAYPRYSQISARAEFKILPARQPVAFVEYQTWAVRSNAPFTDPPSGPSNLPGSVGSQAAGLLPDSDILLDRWWDEGRTGAFPGTNISKFGPIHEGRSQAGYGRTLPYTGNGMFLIPPTMWGYQQETAPGSIPLLMDEWFSRTLFYVQARYITADGQKSRWAGAYAAIFTGKRPGQPTTPYDFIRPTTSIPLYTAGSPVPSRYFAATSFLAATAVPGVNGVTLTFEVEMKAWNQRELIVTIYRAPDVGGSPGDWQLLYSYESQPVGTPTSKDKIIHLDPVQDGGLYWYKARAEVPFLFDAMSESAEISAKAMQVADGADVTSDVARLTIKNPNFDLGDMHWVKGTGWTIVLK